jgi:hypothetical protein
MLNWNDYQYQQERYADFVKEAEIDRMLQTPGSKRKSHKPVHRRAMAGFGRRLVTWGWRLPHTNEP